MEPRDETLWEVLKYLRNHKNVPDLHSALCSFKSLTTAMIEVNPDNTVTVFIHSPLKSPYWANFDSINAVMDFFVNDRLTEYAI